ncbi:DUF4118 domain-containing protein [Paraburkholderia humisilvae]|uniref:Uncharacterized protein n=1 Tax=Paraburkholderia humisilvae TaxID=627669 RepID=A0A6J5F838_9BURK|nr:DUF4118 domain-containing protein [Paraburkholderia humisilvae]CAB3774543.1 hypothetical protein LMG29542_07920 [Paraburkholderia humisilvae]
MKVRNARNWAPGGARRWCFAAGVLAVASALRIALHPAFAPMFPGTIFCIAASLVEYYFGLAPALTVMVFGLGIADLMYAPSCSKILCLGIRNRILLAPYPFVTLILIVLIERLRREQFRAELIASVAKSRYEMLLRHDNERMLARRAVDETHRMLRHLVRYHDGFILIKGPDLNAGRGATAHERATRKMVGPVEVTPGPLFDALHPADVERFVNALWPGNHRVRLRSRQHEQEFQLTDGSCERFATHVGDFLVLRIEC